MKAVFAALEDLARQIPFTEAYIFGSLIKPYRYSPHSDVDLAFRGLHNKDFFPAMAFLSRKLQTEVDVVQLETHPLKAKILQEGVRWKRKG